ncbi:MAG: hypothetical protein ACD_5C00253G0012 [uncultured bacterium]|nr:MAG: hypothetical protein ACD_5C00253G0012 [uncultured bacterium]
MKKKLISTILVSLVLAGAVGFYGGMKYDQQKSSKTIANQSAGFGRGTDTNQREQGQQGGQGMRQNGPGGGFMAGQIVSKDDSSISIKTKDGSSQIIFFSDATTIDKSVSGSKDDLSVGQQITANGKASTDGSMAAQIIQIRPDQVN